MRTEGYPWEQLYERLQVLYIAYRNSEGFVTQEMMIVLGNDDYKHVWNHLNKMEKNGELERFKIPDDVRMHFCITKAGISRVERLRKSNILRDDYPEETWRIH